MTTEAENPYASPKAGDAAPPCCPMPSSVKLAIGCLLLFGAVVAANLLRWLTEYGDSAAFLGFHLVPLLLIAGVVEGMRRRNPVAGAAAFGFSAIVAAMFSVLVAGAVAIFVAERWWGIGVHDTEFNGVPVPTNTALPSYWVATVVLAALATLLGTACVGLMTRSARRFFQHQLPTDQPADPV
ncbi:hypothetical protein Pla123a_18090 [Posidoniimonas polymericola]|uniref:Transmembrane protein n=1 Tax=Posidoniimonas polymericola TaxID=2528002 RepID=A0A5C5YSS8_9BACT|nr:hypothetical protein [Posidoniimonas polymericola]TWT78009.1 hypothetical protein Pla123a_18090 [Posidoniimonas polymericola]